MNRFQFGLIACCSFLPIAAQAQNVLQDSAIEQQQQAIQEQITAGITNGSLSAADVAALQNQQDNLARQAQGGAVAGAVSPGVQRQLSGNSTMGNNGSPLNSPSQPHTAAQTNTGPDPFTYNSLGPDAYHAQKYQNPGYNVPAYPTSQPVPADVNQQYSGPSSGAPYGAGPAQAPGAGGALPQVYSYHTGTNR